MYICVYVMQEIWIIDFSYVQINAWYSAEELHLCVGLQFAVKSTLAICSLLHM